jgi:hypothetical protein
MGAEWKLDANCCKSPEACRLRKLAIAAVKAGGISFLVGWNNYPSGNLSGGPDRAVQVTSLLEEKGIKLNF